MLENVPDMEANDLSIFFWTEDATYKHVYTMLDGLFTDPRSVTAEEFYAVQWERLFRVLNTSASIRVR
mgnify:CR=1 FL=1